MPGTPTFADVYAGLTVPVHHSGDVLARFRVRVEGFDASVALLHALLARVERVDRDGAPPSPVMAGASSGVGVVEGWRGTIVHRSS